MVDSNKKRYVLSADFGEEAGSYNWKSNDDLKLWITQLISDWSWLSGQGNHPANSAWNQINRPLNDANSNVQQAVNYLSQGQEQAYDQYLNSAKGQLENLIRSYPWLLESGRRSFLDDLKLNGKSLEASIIAASWMNQDLSSVPVGKTIQALMAFELFELGIKDKVKTESSALKKLVGSIQNRLTSCSDLEMAQKENFDALVEHVEMKSAANQEAFDSSQASRDESFTKQLSDAQAELDKLKDTYDKHMAIAAPVAYWDGKRSKHAWWALGTAVLAGVSMCLIGKLLINELDSISLAIVAESAANKTSGSVEGASGGLIQSASAWKVGSFVLLATLAFWFIRLTVRIFLSHIHLENDAAERVTMAKTYLALNRDGAFANQDNMGTVLAALFRPTGDGIVKDEGLPPSAMEWLTKLSGNK